MPAPLVVLPPVRDRASCGCPFIVCGGIYAVAGVARSATVPVERSEAHKVAMTLATVSVAFAVSAYQSILRRAA